MPKKLCRNGIKAIKVLRFYDLPRILKLCLSQYYLYMEGFMKSTKGIKKLLMALALVLCVAAFVPATASVQAEAKQKKLQQTETTKKHRR